MKVVLQYTISTGFQHNLLKKASSIPEQMGDMIPNKNGLLQVLRRSFHKGCPERRVFSLVYGLLSRGPEREFPLALS